MSGIGERFLQAGYTVPKFLIEVEGRPIITHVIDMFPGEKDYLFICNQEHLDNPQWKLESVLKRHCPTGRVLGIPSHKYGPAHTVLQAEHLIAPECSVIVNYCDFSCYWDWNDFKGLVIRSNCAGALPAYRGLHPHSLGGGQLCLY